MEARQEGPGTEGSSWGVLHPPQLSSIQGRGDRAKREEDL